MCCACSRIPLKPTPGEHRETCTPTFIWKVGLQWLQLTVFLQDRKRHPVGSLLNPRASLGSVLVAGGTGWPEPPGIQFEKVRKRFCSVGNMLKRLSDSMPIML